MSVNAVAAGNHELCVVVLCVITKDRRLVASLVKAAAILLSRKWVSLRVLAFG